MYFPNTVYLKRKANYSKRDISSERQKRNRDYNHVNVSKQAKGHSVENDF